MNDPIAERLFKNAVDSVELGLEDFRLAKRDRRRYVSATRNVFAGMLLLFKSWLAEKSAAENYWLLRAKVKELKTKQPEDWTDISVAKTAGFDDVRTGSVRESTGRVLICCMTIATKLSMRSFLEDREAKMPFATWRRRSLLFAIL